MVLYLVLESIYQDDLMLVDDRHVDSLLSLIRSKRANSRIYLPNEVVVKKSYQELYFENKADVLASYEIELEDFAYLPNGKHQAIVDEEDGTGNDVSRLDSKECVLPLTVRTRKLGDKMSLKGTNGQKKLKDIFIDKKVPLSDRDLWPVVVDAKGTIVFLPGLQKSKFDKSKSENYDIIVKYY